MMARVVGATRIPGDLELPPGEAISRNHFSSTQKRCAICMDEKKIGDFPVGFFSCDYYDKSIPQAVSKLFTPLEQRHSDKVCIECIQNMLIEANPPNTRPEFPFFESKVVCCPSCRADIFAIKVIRCFPEQADRLFPGLRKDIAIYSMENISAHTSALFMSIFCTFVVRVAGFGLADQFAIALGAGFGPLVENVRDSYPITAFGLNPTIHKIIALSPILTRLVGAGVVISSMKIIGL